MGVVYNQNDRPTYLRHPEIKYFCYLRNEGVPLEVVDRGGVGWVGHQVLRRVLKENDFSEHERRRVLKGLPLKKCPPLLFQHCQNFVISFKNMHVLDLKHPNAPWSFFKNFSWKWRSKLKGCQGNRYFILTKWSGRPLSSRPRLFGIFANFRKMGGISSLIVLYCIFENESFGQIFNKKRQSLCTTCG